MNSPRLCRGILNKAQIVPKNWSAIWLAGHVAGILTLVFAYSSFAQGAKLGTNCLVSFATVEAGKNILTNRDDFIAALSSFDRAARMKTNREVVEKEFLEFLGRSVLVWVPEETNQLSAVLETLRPRLAPWHIPLPSTIPLIKTSGMEEGNASYTRQNANMINGDSNLATPRIVAEMKKVFQQP